MKTSVRTTSLDAYSDLLPRMGMLEQKVFGAIKFYYGKNDRWPSDKDILEVMNTYDRKKKWAISDVNARRNGLMKKGLVTDSGTRIDPWTNKRVTMWQIIENVRKTNQ